MDQVVQAQQSTMQQRETALSMKANKEIHDMKVQLELFLNIDASATARCLSCFDRRAQLQNQNVVGSDGKTYQMQGPGAEKLPLPTVQPPRGGNKHGSKTAMLGGAGAPLHSIRTQALMRAEDCLSKNLGRAASVQGLGYAEGHQSPVSSASAVDLSGYS
mmetsp:Transcript_86130/g.267595  ORF Transcript_86130/g.267595 Transcript_86130/m.267595 type:complete len:160 (-) Transcript_86130:99-578(-)